MPISYKDQLFELKLKLQRLSRLIVGDTSSDAEFTEVINDMASVIAELNKIKVAYIQEDLEDMYRQHYPQVIYYAN